MFMVGSRTTGAWRNDSNVNFRYVVDCPGSHAAGSPLQLLGFPPYHVRLGKVGYGDYVPHSFPGYVSVAWEKLLFFESHSLGKDKVFWGGGNSNSLYFQPDPWGKII